MFRKSFSELTRRAKSKRLKSHSACQRNESEGTDPIEDKRYFDVPSTVDVGDPFCQVQNLPSINDSEWYFGQEPLSDSDDESDGDDDEFYCHLNELESIKKSLHKWSSSFDISKEALSALLSILKPHKCFRSLPTDPRTLVDTPTSVSMIPVDPGHYSHMGLENNLKNIWGMVREEISHIELLFNIDGLPLFKSSAIELWPISAMVINAPSIKSLVFPIGVYCGAGKPKNCADYLREFVSEVQTLMRRGIDIDGKLLTLSIKGFVGDTPAKSYVLSVKGHAGYSSCTKCKEAGVWVDHRMTFPDLNAAARTNEGFLSREDEDFHTGETLLVTIPGLDFVRGFPLDYMHLVCLGVVRSVVYLWMFGPIPIRLHSQIINRISAELVSLQSSMPVEFNRKPRTLNDIKRWKATEFRQFLLYTGPVVLKNVFKNEHTSLYDNFLTLSIAISILVSNTLCSDEYVRYAKELLMHFVKTVGELYGKQYLTHNMHSLIHLSDNVEDFGPLDSSSAFPFENFLQIFKKLVRKGDKPLPQIIKRLTEKMSSDSLFVPKLPASESPTFSRIHYLGPLMQTSDSSKQFSCISFGNFTVSTKQPNSCCVLKSGSIVVVKNVVFSKNSKQMVIVCEEFLDKCNFYSSPFLNSSALGVYLVSNLSQLREHSVKDIAGKMVLLPFNDKHVAFPLLHS